MDVARSVTEFWKIWLAGGAVVLVIAWPRLAARWRTAVLWILVALSTANYARYGLSSLVERIDAYDLTHTYLSAKYFDELGYQDLLPCLILAEHDDGGPTRDPGPSYLARNQGGDVVNPIAHALARGRHVRASRFSPQRWEAFEHDALVLVRDEWRGGDELYRQLLMDHGFDAPPAWVVVAGPLASAVPIERVKWLGYPDLLLLVGAVLLVGWAWDRDAAGWVALFLLVTYSTRWPTIPWALLRYDYAAGLIAATALLKKGRPLLAGLVGGWAAAVRLFPALWLWGPVARAGISWWRNRRIGRPLALLFLGFALALGGLVGGAVARYGSAPVATQLQIARDHGRPSELSSRRIGFALALSHSPDAEPRLGPAQRQRMASQRGPRTALAVGLLLALGWALRGRGDAEAWGFGFVPFFLLTTAAYFYYVSRATLVAVHAGELDRARNRAGLAWLFALEVFSNWAAGAHPGNRMFLFGYLSWGLALYAAGLVGFLLWEAGIEARLEGER